MLAVAGAVFVWRSFANPAIPLPTADLNGDGVVDVADVSRFLSLLQNGDPAADLNADGRVSIADMSVLLAAYTPPAVTTAEAPAAVPATPPAPTPTPATTPPAPTPAPIATPPPVAPPAQPAATQEYASDAECPNQSDPAAGSAAMLEAVQCLTANARRFHNVTASARNATLAESAAAKAADIANCGFSHTACDREAKYWIVDKGYDGRCWAENIARGQKTARQVFTDWMNSSSHRAAILAAGHTELGVAQAPSDKGLVWVQHFGGCR